MSDNDKKPDNDPFNFFKLSPEPGNSNKDGKKKIPFWVILLVIVAITAVINLIFVTKNNSDTIPFSTFRQMIEGGQIDVVELSDTYFYGYNSALSVSDSSYGRFSSSSQSVYKTAAIYTEDFMRLLDQKGVTYKAVVKQNNYLLEFILNWILPMGLLLLVWRFIFKKMGGGLGGGLFSAGQSRSAAVEEGQVKTRFTDVAGVDEAKEELVEVVDFLKSPKKYTDIGGKIPKGVLLVGPPGTGKTLLARAVAGEAGVPFFRISGSDFVEMFVGVGASRVRDLFKQAREKAPCIVFIDELDAIGKSRVNSINGGNDEREQTLNQLLVEMDGFDNSKGLILLAATNRPDVLDPALLRPGRFDRQVVVDPPDSKGRIAILKIHSKNVKIGGDVNFESVAHATSGFSGADLANVVNEAALLAVRAGRKVVTMADFDEAVEKTVAGLQKKSRVVRENERKIIAYHETGHALAAAFTQGADKVHKISIIPRGTHALGYTLQVPDEDRFLYTEKDLINEIDTFLGGRAAEQIIFGEISTGAANDLQRATDLVRRMITDYGMSTKFRNVVLSQRGSGYGAAEPQLVREYSEDTQQFIDSELARILNERYQHVIELLTSKKVLLEYIAGRLLEKEVVEEAEFADIIKAEAHLAELPAGENASLPGTEGASADSAS